MPARIDIVVAEDPIDLAAALAEAAPDGADGAMVSFTGHVRAEPGCDALELSHYPGMTEKLIRRIAEQAADRFGLSGLTVRHRVGVMQAGETIVLVLAVARHRHAAFDAARFTMDWLKTKAPFWKRTSNGAWVDARSEDDAAASAWG
ncbi:MAG: molybdenum cofactor biosynthesis protein MoaE [Rhodothalassiaceae bacterium]